MEMWLRIAATASVGFIDDCQAVYRKHEGNMSTAYVENFGLGDLQQKKGAIDCFFETCANVLPNADELKGRYYSALSRLAVARASAAFSEGRLALSDQLSDLAVSADVSARRSWPWAKLKIKRRIGYDTWRNLQPRIARFRKL
jgi:hypothetical protein